MPNVGIVCRRRPVADIEEAVDVLDEVTGDETKVREALYEIIDAFQSTEASGVCWTSRERWPRSSKTTADGRSWATTHEGHTRSGKF